MKLTFLPLPVPRDPKSNPLFEQYYAMYSLRIERDAVRIAKGDCDLAEDIAQVGIVSMWNTSLTGEISGFAYPDALSKMLKERSKEYGSGVVVPEDRVYTPSAATILRKSPKRPRIPSVRLRIAA